MHREHRERTETVETLDVARDGVGRTRSHPSHRFRAEPPSTLRAWPPGGAVVGLV